MMNSEFPNLAKLGIFGSNNRETWTNSKSVMENISIVTWRM